MVDLENAIVARFESHGETFEILIDPDVVRYVREGKDIDLMEHMVIDDIFNDARKGTRPSEEKILEVFKTNDVLEIARTIILRGEVQLTTDQRREITESKRKRIIAEIARNAINPQTKTPHPATRIELALEEAKFHVDPFKPVDQQIKKAMDILRPLIPIKFARTRIAVRLSAEDYGRCFEELKSIGTIEQEEWQKDGTWIGILDIPAGMYDEFIARLKAKTKGAADIRAL
ncbi:MAG: ribosome maturation protein [Candidatus Methanomethylophilaceae archaeon]|nr:ribosome maturation protein [Candidatus Methanomethylophilaceae archaeon]MDI3541704.1 ribosome maturation protein [Candidatus Methanomethylophilaceae archaeon]